MFYWKQHQKAENSLCKKEQKVVHAMTPKYKSGEKFKTQKQKQEEQEIHFQGELEDFGGLPP